jgi:superfamily II DNA helicase RecQ
VFIVTNVLGVGIDVLMIQVVIYIGVLKELKQYSQESGRAGRDRQASKAIIMQATYNCLFVCLIQSGYSR